MARVVPLGVVDMPEPADLADGDRLFEVVPSRIADCDVNGSALICHERDPFGRGLSVRSIRVASNGSPAFQRHA